MKKLICCLLTITCLLSCFMTTTIYAAADTPSADVLPLSSEDENPNDFSLSYYSLVNATNISEQGYINNWNNFQKYYTDDFDEFANENNCGPTQVANLLSYYKSIGYIYAFPGDRITQSYYTNTICTAVEYSATQKGKLNDAANGFKEIFESGASYYSVTISKKTTLSWDSFKTSINSNKPIMLAAYSHLYLVLGYQVRDGVKYYVCYGAFSNPNEEYALIEFSTYATNRRVITIN